MGGGTEQSSVTLRRKGRGMEGLEGGGSFQRIPSPQDGRSRESKDEDQAKRMNIPSERGRVSERTNEGSLTKIERRDEGSDLLGSSGKPTHPT